MTLGTTALRSQCLGSLGDPSTGPQVCPTSPRATSHAPSGGSKSEISKAITGAFIFGNAYTTDFDADIDTVESDRRPRPFPTGSSTSPTIPPARSYSPTHSVSSVIKLLTPSTDAYNEIGSGSATWKGTRVRGRLVPPAGGEMAQSFTRRHRKRPAKQARCNSAIEAHQRNILRVASTLRPAPRLNPASRVDRTNITLGPAPVRRARGHKLSQIHENLLFSTW